MRVESKSTAQNRFCDARVYFVSNKCFSQNIKLSNVVGIAPRLWQDGTIRWRIVNRRLFYGWLGCAGGWKTNKFHELSSLVLSSWVVEGRVSPALPISPNEAQKDGPESAFGSKTPGLTVVQLILFFFFYSSSTRFGAVYE